MTAFLFLIILISVVNLAVGFFLAHKSGLGAPTIMQSLDILAGAGTTGVAPPMLDEPDEIQMSEEDFTGMLSGLVTADLADMLDDRSAEVADVAPDDEPYDDDVAELAAPGDTEHWYLSEKYVETSILMLNIAMMKSGKRATEIDTLLRAAGANATSDQIEACVQRLKEDCEQYLEEQEEAAGKIRDRLDEFGELSTLAEDIELANLEQGAQIETTISNLAHMDFTSDPAKGVERLLEELNNLRMARHRLRDSQEIAFLTVARYEDRLGDVDEQLYNDALTKMRNRIGIEIILHNWWNQGRQKSRQITMGLLDLNNFGQINEDHGAETGDRILAYVGHLLRQEMSESDVVGRFSGQTFIIMTMDVGYRGTLKSIETLRQKLGRTTFHTFTGEIQIQLTATGAVAEVRPDDTDEGVLKRLSGVLAAAKAAGRDHMFAIEPNSLDLEPELVESPGFVSDYYNVNLSEIELPEE